MHNPVAVLTEPVTHPIETARKASKLVTWLADVALFLANGFSCSPDSGHDPVDAGREHEIICRRCHKRVVLDGDKVRWVA